MFQPDTKIKPWLRDSAPQGSDSPTPKPSDRKPRPELFWDRWTLNTSQSCHSEYNILNLLTLYYLVFNPWSGGGGGEIKQLIWIYRLKKGGNKNGNGGGEWKTIPVWRTPIQALSYMNFSFVHTPSSFALSVSWYFHLLAWDICTSVFQSSSLLLSILCTCFFQIRAICTLVLWLSSLVSSEIR